MKQPSPVRMVAGPGLHGRRRGTLDIVYSADAPHAARRFEKLQGALLRNAIEFSAPGARLAAFLVAFDAVVTRESLGAALNACASAYAYRDAVCIDWAAPCGRTDRRHLSLWTQFVLAQPAALSLAPEQSIELLDQCLLANVVAQTGLPQGLDGLLADAQAWLAFAIAGPWVAHATGAMRLAGLPRSVYARAVSGKALAVIADDEKKESARTADTAIGFALDAYLGGETTDGGYWLIDEILVCCPAHASRREMVKSFLIISMRDKKGRISSLILAWAVDLAESGTPGDDDISPRTVSKYVRAIARLLLEQFRGKALENLQSADFDAIYKNIIESMPAGSRRNAASALSSWHFFLECWLDVAPRTKSLHRDLPLPLPRANILWPHEISKVSEWLKATDGESRLRCQLRIAFAIASTIRIRTKELLMLRMENVRLIKDAVEIEVSTATADGGMKSENAHQPHLIECSATAALIRDFKKDRQKELAMPDDYLFGDPHQGHKTFQPGQMQVLLNRLLKDATGDRSVSIHTLSHTWVTREFHQASLGQSARDVNAYDALSARAAHGDASTTFRHYVHRFEEAMRSGIDNAIAPRLHWPEMAPFVNLSHGNYRQRLSRGSRSGTHFDELQCKFGFIRAALPSMALPAADFGIVTTEATTSVNLERAATSSFREIVNILIDVALGMPQDVIALRACRTPEEIIGVAKHAREVLAEIGESQTRHGASSVLDPVDDLSVALASAARNHIDFGRIGQKKLLPLREILANGPSDPFVHDATVSWLRCYEHGYLALTRPSQVVGLVRLLHMAGVPSSRIGIFHVPVSDEIGIRLQQDIDAAFLQSYAAIPLKRECRARGGRPAAYVVLSGTDFTRRASSATLCNKGLNAILLAACVLQRL